VSRSIICVIRRAHLTAAAVAACLCLGACGTAQAVVRSPLTSIGYVQLAKDAGPAPILDQLSLDQRVGRLYVAHTSNSALDVVDLAAEKLVGSVSGLKGIRGVALTPNPEEVYTSDAGDGTVGVVDLKVMRVVRLIPVGGQPDAIAYDALHDVVVVALPAERKLAFIDRTLRRVVGSLSLPGTPDLLAVDANTGQVFTAINDRDQVIVVDVSNQQVTTVLRGCAIKSPTGLAYDPDQNRLFVADHLVMSVIDLLLDRCLGSVNIGDGTDQVVLNPHTHHLLAANAGSRNLSVIDAISLEPVGVATTGPRAGSVAVDPLTDRVYVALPQSGSIAILHDP
jgi:YVTN family beta-propeller protein